MPFSPIEEIVEDIKAGKMVIVCDDEDRENEGDLTIAAEKHGEPQRSPLFIPGAAVRPHPKLYEPRPATRNF